MVKILRFKLNFFNLQIYYTFFVFSFLGITTTKLYLNCFIFSRFKTIFKTKYKTSYTYAVNYYSKLFDWFL